MIYINETSQVDKNVSIVTNIPGTTRDIVEQKINLNGFPVYFNDTAGIRKTKSMIEEEGIKKTRQIINKSNIILNLSDKGDFNLPMELKNTHIVDFNLFAIICHYLFSTREFRKLFLNEKLYLCDLKLMIFPPFQFLTYKLMVFFVEK